MKILLSDAGKRFNSEWVFRHAALQFLPGQSYAITGANGSGKSTLLQAIAGAIQLSEGNVSYSCNDESVEVQDAYRHISFCAPYFELVEEMTLTELLRFHQRFKPLIKTVDEIIDTVQLAHAAGKQIRNYSSGMKQRVKLAQAFFSNTSCLLLDEPCSNLDQRGIELYQQLIEQYTKDRLLIICSNDEQEYSLCNEILSMQAFKDIGRRK